MKKIIFIFLALFVMVSCEEPFEPDFADEEPTIVIEGYIQSGEQALPPYVIISKTYPLFQTGEVQSPQVYLGGAEVVVKHNAEEYALTEICTEDLTPELIEQLFGFVGIDSSLTQQNLCFYIDAAGAIQAEEGETYDLEISFEDNLLTASTTIPRFIPIDSVQLQDVGFDGYRTMNAFISDPAGPDFYRLRASVNGSPYYADFSSVTDDVFFDGKSFEFPVPKPFSTIENVEDFDPNLAGLYEVGDTTSLEWQLIDEDHFDFWNTLEFARANEGPFSSYSRAKDNIDGGIGVWGGSVIKYYEVIVQ